MLDTRVTLTASCLRGAFIEVIRDHSTAVFIDSLIAVGYTFPDPAS